MCVYRYAQLIAAYVVCFPALDVGSAYPLCAITLGIYYSVIAYVRMYVYYNSILY